MQIDQARHEHLTGGIHHVGALGHLDIGCGPDRHDPLAADHHDCIVERGGAGAVDQLGADDRSHRLFGAPRRRR